MWTVNFGNTVIIIIIGWLQFRVSYSEPPLSCCNDEFKFYRHWFCIIRSAVKLLYGKILVYRCIELYSTYFQLNFMKNGKNFSFKNGYLVSVYSFFFCPPLSFSFSVSLSSALLFLCGLCLYFWLIKGRYNSEGYFTFLGFSLI